MSNAAVTKNNCKRQTLGELVLFMAQVAGVDVRQQGQSVSRCDSEDLPCYTENPAYESTPQPRRITRQAVRRHESKVKQDLKRQAKDEAACSKILPYVPEIYRQLTEAASHGPVLADRSGPAALRPAHLRESDGVEVTFVLRGVDQKALRRNLPRLLVEYAHEQEIVQGNEDRERMGSTSGAPLLHAQTAPASTTSTEEARAELQRRASLHRAATSLPAAPLDADRLQVKALYFDAYMQKIYFSKRFVGMFKKDDAGERHVGLGLCLILFGVKLGLPLLDVITWAALDLPRLALQGISGKQKLKLSM